VSLAGRGISPALAPGGTPAPVTIGGYCMGVREQFHRSVQKRWLKNYFQLFGCLENEASHWLIFLPSETFLTLSWSFQIFFLNDQILLSWHSYTVIGVGKAKGVVVIILLIYELLFYYVSLDVVG